METPVSVTSPALGAERPTAAIIAFPSRGVPAARPEDRLNRALVALDAAMQKQRAAIAAWCETLGTLQAATAKLDASLLSYESNLDRLSGGVSALQATARALEQRADCASPDQRLIPSG